MATPTFADYVELLITLFERFWQHEAARSHRGRPFVSQHKALIVCFVVMQQRRTFRFKAQHRWLQHHPDLRQHIGLPEVPNRTTLSRRYKGLYPVLQDFIAFVGQYAQTSTPSSPARTSTRIRACSRPRGPSGTRATARLGRFPISSATSTRRPPGAKAGTMAGSMAVACTWSTTTSACPNRYILNRCSGRK
jgi:hypothetical protein